MGWSSPPACLSIRDSSSKFALVHCVLHRAASGTGTLPDPAPAINQARHLSAAAGTQDPTETTFFVTPPGRGQPK